MAYSYQLLPEAEVDLDEAVTWYGDKNPPVSQRFLNEFARTIARITTNPEQFPVAKGKIRKARFSGAFPYSVFFVVKGDMVFVISVFHDKRNPAVWKART